MKYIRKIKYNKEKGNRGIKKEKINKIEKKPKNKKKIFKKSKNKNGLLPPLNNSNKTKRKQVA